MIEKKINDKNMTNRKISSKNLSILFQCVTVSVCLCVCVESAGFRSGSMKRNFCLLVIYTHCWAAGAAI